EAERYQPTSGSTRKRPPRSSCRATGARACSFTASPEPPGTSGRWGRRFPARGLPCTHPGCRGTGRRRRRCSTPAHRTGSSPVTTRWRGCQGGGGRARACRWGHSWLWCSPRGTRAAGRAAIPLLEWLRPWVLKDATDLLDEGARAEAPVLRAWPSARLRDLWEMQDLAWGSAARVTCPVLVLVAAQDHVVDEAGAAALVRRLEKSPSVRYVRIENSAHILPRDRNHELVAAEVTGFIERTLGPAAVR